MANTSKDGKKNPLNVWIAIGFTLTILGFIVWSVISELGINKSLTSNILGLVVLAFAITTLILIALSEPQTKFSKIISSAFPLLVMLTLTSYFLENTLSITWFPEVIVAWGTILLAFATFQLGQTTQNENAKLIAENREIAVQNTSRQKQERKAELRSEILKWAVDINSFAIRNGTPAVGYLISNENVASGFVSDHVGKWLYEIIDPARSWAEYADEVSKVLSADISTAVSELKEKLRDQIRLLHDIDDGKVKEKNAMEQARTIAAMYDKIHDVAVNLIKTIASGDTADL